MSPVRQEVHSQHLTLNELSDDNIIFDWSNPGDHDCMPTDTSDYKHYLPFSGIFYAAISGMFGAFCSLSTKICFDFTGRDTYGDTNTAALQAVSIVHQFTDFIIIALDQIFGDFRSLYEHGMTRFLDVYTLPVWIDTFTERSCQTGVDKVICLIDWNVRLFVFGMNILLGTLMVQYYTKSLNMLSTSIAATAASLASNVIVSGIIGVLVFDEWLYRSAVGIMVWLTGSALMVLGVWLIGTDGFTAIDERKNR